MLWCWFFVLGRHGLWLDAYCSTGLPHSMSEVAKLHRAATQTETHTHTRNVYLLLEGSDIGQEVTSLSLVQRTVI